MTDRIAFIGLQLERLRAFWPNLPATESALDEWVDLFQPFSENEIRAAVTMVRNTYGEQGAPKPAHLLDAIRAVRMDKPHTFSQPNPNQPLCTVCGTMRSLWDDGIESPRNGPSHLKSCPHYGEKVGTTTEDLTRFASERSEPIHDERGQAAIGDLVEKAAKAGILLR